MKSQKISVIVPVFQGEQFIQQCLESLDGQTHKNFELIIVVDYEPENQISKEICTMFAKSRPYVKLIINPPEKRLGVSHARNVALENIAPDSQFVAFVDADDWVEPTFLETLLQSILGADADMAYCGYKVSKPTKKHINNRCTPPHSIYASNQALMRIIGHELMTLVLWNKLFKVGLCKDLRFDENLHFVEDTLWVFQYFSRCKKIVCTRQKLYHYIKHSGSALSTGTFENRKTEIQTYEQISVLAGKNSQTQKIVMRAWQYLMMIEKFWLLSKSKQKFEAEKQELRRVIKQNRVYYLAAKKHFAVYRQLGVLCEKLSRI